jgi:phospholipid/cholesterol/gamma-HCH transport system ATP-binding protein
MTVFENVAYRPRELGWPEEEIQRRVSDVLAFMDLADVADDLPGDLSGGTQRRVAIARAVVDQPQIILYDEPTVGLDPQTAHKLCEAAIRLRDIEGVTSLFVTHRIDDLRFLASKYMLPSSEGGLEMHDKEDRLCLVNTRFIMLNEGKVIFDGTEEQLYASEDPFLREFTNLDEEP